MPVSYILRQSGYKTGLNPADTNERAVLLRFLNEAAEELYDQSDPSESLVEQTFKINGDQTVSLPAYVGRVRALREQDTYIPWTINRLKPRYYQSNWKDAWRNIRLKNLSALQASIRNESVVTIKVPIVETTPITVTITGSTNFASSISEDIVMDDNTKQTTYAYTEISSIKKNAVNMCDVTVNDVDGMLLAVIPNNFLESSYQIIDVSICPWLNNSGGNLDHYLEILYKKPLPWLQEDDDEYPVKEHDNVLVNKIIQLWAEEQGKVDIATAYDAKATRSLARKQEDLNRASQDVVSLQENCHDYLLPRLRGRRPSRYGGYYNYGTWGLP